ncbi:nucleotidyl transferase AbiEii/AbiGii toxin family protein [Candidatus Micrarchaeota archaeon]|nr:nucleotidyl transferase AbiEii/AbiGii toxin family protein [Candidatus Micrarchaeota archaeon]
MTYPPAKVRELAEIIAASSKLPVGLVEKDIWITYSLREIFSFPESRYLVFKGGTCLVRAYLGYFRFSEDIDLTWANGEIKEHAFRKNVIGKLMAGLGLQWDFHDRVKTGIAGTHSGKVMNYFFLTPKNGGKLKVTVAFDERLAFPAKRMKLKRLEVPKDKERELEAMFGHLAKAYFSSLELPCYSIQEIGAEKVRAVLTRRLQPARSRDLFDLYKMVEGSSLYRVAPAEAVRAKMALAMKTPAYVKEYRKNMENLGKHLQELSVQTTFDPVFIEKPDLKALQSFAEKLEKYIGGLDLPATK